MHKKVEVDITRKGEKMKEEKKGGGARILRGGEKEGGKDF